MKKVSVIMASFLGFYPGRASNPEKKFIRAVNSFLSQTYENKELIIVADGCDMTEIIYNKYFSDKKSIKFIKIDKQPIYSGEMRNAGLRLADGDIISYLDNDDVIGKKHIETIMEQFSDDVDLVYYDDYVVHSSDFKKLYRRVNDLKYGGIGTSSITHRNVEWVSWRDGYGHDFFFIISLVMNGMRFEKIKKSPSYLVCHTGNTDF